MQNVILLSHLLSLKCVILDHMIILVTKSSEPTSIVSDFLGENTAITSIKRTSGYNSVLTATYVKNESHFT